MKFLSREQIDTELWNSIIQESEIENIFCYSWYLDATAKNWGAIVSDNYDTIVPIPYSKKLGVKQMYQPQFTRELDIFGNNFTWNEVLEFLSKEYKSIQFRNGSNTILETCKERKHQFLALNEEPHFSTNAKRLIKKSSVFIFKKSSDPQKLIALFRETTFDKIDSISEEDVEKLQILMKVALANGHGVLIEIYEENDFVGAGFFLKDKKRITYLKSACKEDAKKLGAMYGLINFAVASYKTNFDTLDFGGSDIESVANFYKKFGSKDRSYYNYTINNLPSWFKAIKRIK